MGTGGAMARWIACMRVLLLLEASFSMSGPMWVIALRRFDA
jgi:hypothetical protein